MKREVIPTIFFALLFPLSVVQYGQVFDFKLILVELFLLIFSILYLFFFKIPKIIAIVFLLYFPTILFCLFNPIFSQVYEMIYVFILYFVFLSTSISYGSNLKKHSFIFILNFFSFFCIFIHLLGFLIPDDNNLPGFSGVFGNPNIYGLFSCTSFVFLLISILELKYKPHWNLYFSLFFSILGVFLSISRSSLSICIFVILSYFFLVKIRTRKISFRFLFVSFITIIFVGFISLYFNIFNEFLNKNNSLGDDLSNGRLDLWSYGIDIMNYTGLGRDFYSPFDLGFHNNYINIGVIFGKNILISNLFFWFGLLLFLIYKYFCKNGSKFVFPMMMLVLMQMFWSIEVGSSFIFVWIFCLVFGYNLKNINPKVN
ncbi:O-antigen ligase family protein [Acinetobacter terrestris]|uniref:O-antigen ligase family protein n=1 Tax=Acinetobacter terrestris TaxID=2529843 RepID=UPI0010401EE8|nr:O-antigen ligase family protein [Acinetobacter terrestris]TCB65700.1 hypothetical protein E0H81_06470 [Acinetobacter terrestris]